MIVSKFIGVSSKSRLFSPFTRIITQFGSKTMSDDAGKKNDIQFESLGMRLERIRERTAVKTEYKPPNYVSALVPTLHSDSFDMQGRKIHPWIIPKVFDHLDMTWPQYRQSPDPGSPESGIYILKLQIDINPELYSLDCPMHPLLLEGRLLFVKRSSRAYENTLRHPSLDKPYAIMTGLDVNVNLVTRRPTPYPDSWRHESIPSEGSALGFEIPAKSRTFKTKRQVYQSDIDENGHVNYTSYIRFCHDVFVDNIYAGNYSAQNAADLMEGGVKQMQVVFKNESLRGDILDIESWEDEKDGGTYCFELRKGGGTRGCISISIF